MTSHLRSSFLLFPLLPLGLHAQVLAGDATGLSHIAVGILISPEYGPPPMSSNDTASIDLQSDGAFDLRFNAGNVHAFDADGSYAGLDMLQEGLEVAVDVPGGYVAKRLDPLDPVDGSLTWRAYVQGGPNSLVLGSLLTDFGGQWVATGADQWLVNGAVATQGYLGVRTVQADDTLYGWVNLTSFVSQDSAWLQIDDFAIETGPTAITNEQYDIGITALLSVNGTLMVQDNTGEPLRITLRDMSGRVVRQVTAASPCRLDISGEARGSYLLTVLERSRSRTFKVAW
jgi:hypothetical protein